MTSSGRALLRSVVRMDGEEDGVGWGSVDSFAIFVLFLLHWFLVECYIYLQWIMIWWILSFFFCCLAWGRICMVNSTLLSIVLLLCLWCVYLVLIIAEVFTSFSSRFHSTFQREASMQEQRTKKPYNSIFGLRVMLVLTIYRYHIEAKNLFDLLKSSNVSRSGRTFIQWLNHFIWRHMCCIW